MSSFARNGAAGAAGAGAAASAWCGDQFLLEIPKTDLHVHLDGSLRLSTLIELAKQEGVSMPSYDEAELRRTVFRDSYTNLPDYLKGFQYTVAVMRTAANLERVAFEFAEDNYLEGVRYFEVRFAPQLVASLKATAAGEKTKEALNIEQVIGAVDRGLKRAKKQFEQERFLREETPPCTPEVPYDYGIIVCAMRSFPPCEYYDAFLEIHENLDYERACALASETLISVAIKCRDKLNIPVVALDVAGAEDGFPNKVHKDAFVIAHENFFNKTVHAGEGFGPESIWQAIRDLHAERIGHGFHLFSEDKVSSQETDSAEYVRKLVKYISDRRINLEVCLTSNLGTMPDLALKDHAFRRMIEHGVSVSLNTDNRLVSDTSMTKEISKAVSAFDLTPKQLREIVVCGFKRSFFAGTYQEKRCYIRRVMDTYDRIAREHDIEGRYNAHISATVVAPPASPSRFNGK